MKLGGERLRSHESVLKCLQCENEWSTMLERHGGRFITPQENLAIGVSEPRTCPGRGSNMSDQPLWKPAWESDMSGLGLSH
jgi:hypothetical protein